MSQRSIAPSALSSVKLPASGVTMLCSLGPKLHCSTGEKLSGGAFSSQSPTASMLSWTLHWFTGGPVSVLVSLVPVLSPAR